MSDVVTSTQHGAPTANFAFVTIANSTSSSPHYTTIIRQSLGAPRTQRERVRKDVYENVDAASQLTVGRGDDAVTSRATSPPLRARSRPTIASTPAR